MKKFIYCLILPLIHPRIVHCVAEMLQLLRYVARLSNIRAHSDFVIWYAVL
jgi:hypothetical protein